MLLAFRHAVFVFLEEFFDVPWHGYVEGSRDVIPFQFNTAVEIARPVFGDAIFFFDTFDEVSCMFFSNIFYTKIIDD
jgi:hypothetical protein